MNIDIIRAWKDSEYRASLSSEELQQLPANPVGEVELTESDLTEIVGGSSVGLFCQLSILFANCSFGC